MLVLVLAAIQPRPEPDRDGVLKTQSAPAQDRRQNIYRYVQRPRGDMRPLLPAGMLELLQGCRICLRLKVGCFKRQATWGMPVHVILRLVRGEMALLTAWIPCQIGLLNAP